MNKLLFSCLKMDDSELRNSLYECSDYSQAIDILKKVETDLDSQLVELESLTDGEKLLDELHKYNDIKDMTQLVIGSLSIIRGVTAAELHREFDLELS
ncbi:DNA repair protein SWI5 homolog [Rhodnius prolixus]